MEETAQPRTADGKRRVKRQSFMGETCPHEGCHREFKIEKDYDQYKLTCPYCGKSVKSVRILQDMVDKR